MARPTKHRGKWRIRPLDADGHRTSEVFDTYNEAAHALRLREIEREEIRSGRRRRPPPDHSFNDLCDYWLDHRAVQKRSEKHDQSIIRAHLRPAFGALRLCEIGVEQADRFVNARKHLGKKTIANHLTLLVTMLNVARDLGWLLEVPRIQKPKIGNSSSFSYLKTPADVSRFLRAAQAEGPMIAALYAMAVWTGMRAGELACLEWADIDWMQRLICVQRSFNGPTKSDEVRFIPILDALLPILKAWRLGNPLKVVFPNENGRRLGESARAFQEILHRVLKRAGFPMVMRGGKNRHYVTFHQLRHTFASQWVMLGGDLFKLQRILGHQSSDMTQRYAHLAPHAFKSDYARFDALAPPTPPSPPKPSTGGRVFKLPPKRSAEARVLKRIAGAVQKTDGQGRRKSRGTGKPERPQETSHE